MSKKPKEPTEEIILPTESGDEIIETPPEPVKPTPRAQNIKVEVSTEKLEKVFNDGFTKLGEMFKPEAPKAPETPKPIESKKERGYQIGDEFDPFLDVGV